MLPTGSILIKIDASTLIKKRHRPSTTTSLGDRPDKSGQLDSDIEIAKSLH